MKSRIIIRGGIFGYRTSERTGNSLKNQINYLSTKKEASMNISVNVLQHLCIYKYSEYFSNFEYSPSFAHFNQEKI